MLGHDSGDIIRIKLIEKTLIITLITCLILISIGSIQAKDINETDTLAEEDINVKTFTELNIKINNTQESVLELNENYRYNSTSDELFNEGVNITKNITITTKSNSYIDGDFLARGLNIAPNCTVTIENITFKNGYSENSGAAIFLNESSKLTLKNCIFINNKVYNSDGGAVNAMEDSTIEVYDCLFENNTSIRVSDLPWDEFKSGMGSALCVRMGSTLTIDRSTFRANNGYLTTILLVSYAHDTGETKTSTLKINNTLFEDNIASSNSVIYLDELGKGEILNSIFKNNKVTEKRGTVVLDACLSALIKNCLFENNTGIDGAAIYIGVFDPAYKSNVSVIDCNFTKNTASENGGAIYARYPSLTLYNSKFTDNSAIKGGAIYSKEGTIKITDAHFERNSAQYGGALFLKSDTNTVDNSIFIQNSASVKGGAVYSTMDEVSSSNCNYISNSAPISKNVYGVYYAQITKYSTYFGDIRLKIKLTSPWNMPLSHKIKIKFLGSKNYLIGTYKTNNDGKVSIKVPKNIDIGKYTIKISMDPGVCSVNPEVIKIVKSPAKVKVKKVTTKYHSGKIMNIHVKNSKTKKAVMGAKLNFKVNNGKSSWSYSVKSNSKGLAKFTTSKLNAGKYKVSITSANKNVQLSKAKTSIKINKVSAKLKAPKSVKKHSPIKITVKNEASGKAIKHNKFQIKISGKTSKTLKAKTDSKGILKLSTNKLSKGKHNINIILKNNNYNIDKKLSVNIK